MERKRSKAFKLPFKVTKYKTYSLNTAINGILEAYGDNEIWLYNNYISLWIYAKRRRKEYMVDFKYDMDVNYYELCPLLKLGFIKVRKNHNIIEIIRENITKRKYIYLTVDTFYIDLWWHNVGQKIHSEHEMLILGYNDEKKVVFAADFFKRVYSIQEISYSDFRKAFDAHMGYIRERDNVDIVEIRTFKYFKNKEYKLCIERIQNMITDFLNSNENTVSDDSDLFTVHEDVLYGIECLNHILDYFKECICKNEQLDYRIIHLIYIFNEIMECRIDYMIQNKYISDNVFIRNIQKNFRDLAHKNEMLRSLVMKYNIKKEKRYGKLIIEKVKKMFWQLENGLKDINIYFENNVVK